MNRLFGTKKAEAPKIQQPVVEEKKIDLVEQSKKVPRYLRRLKTESTNWMESSLKWTKRSKACT